MKYNLFPAIGFSKIKARKAIFIIFLIISISSSFAFNVNLDPGWNMISGPQTFQAEKLDSDCSLRSVAGEKIWGFSNDTWTHPDKLSPGLSYYVYSESECSTDISGLEQEKSHRLSSGWSLISGGKEKGWRCKGKGEIWSYSSKGWRSNTDLSSLSSNEGYWLKSPESCSYRDQGSFYSFTIVAGEQTVSLEYSFKISERPEYLNSTPMNASGESNDNIIEKDDGYLVEGLTGDGAGDAYSIPMGADISNFKVLNYPEDRYSLYINGSEVDSDRFNGAEGSDNYLHPAVPEPPIDTKFGAKERHVTSLPESGFIDVTDDPYNAPTNGEEDAHPAIMQAIEENAGSGKIIYLPAGDYKISDTIRINKGEAPLILKGDGSNTRIISNGDHYGISVGDYRGGNQIEGVIIRDIFVHDVMSKEGQDGASGIGLSNTFEDNNHMEVRNVWIEGFSGGAHTGLRVGANGDSVIKHVTVSGSGQHGINVPNYDDERVKIKSVLAFNNGIHSGLGYGIDVDGTLVEDAVSIKNAQGGKSAPDYPPEDGPSTIWRNVWFIQNDKKGWHTTETVPHGIELDGVYAINNQGWGFRLTDHVEDQFKGDIRARGNGRDGESGNILVRSSILDFERIETCNSKGTGMWVSGGADGNVDTLVHSGNSEGITGSIENLNLGSEVEASCSVPEVPSDNGNSDTSESQSKKALKSVKAESEFEEELDLPKCDPDRSDVKVIDESADWDSINSEDHDVFCVRPGDYRDLGDISVTASGTEDDRRYLIFDGSKDHPLDQQERAVVEEIIFDDASFWTLRGLSIYAEGSENQGSLFVQDGSNSNIFDQMLVTGGQGDQIAQTTLVDFRGNDNVLQNSVVRKARTPNADDLCVGIKSSGENEVIRNNKVVSNQLYDCTDQVQLVIAPGDSGSRYPGTLIAHNDMYFSDQWRTDGEGNFDEDGRYHCGENAIDIKEAGGTSDSKPVRVIGNRMWGGLKADEDCGASGGGVHNPIIVHDGADGKTTKKLEFRNNIVIGTPKAMGLQGEYIDVKNNLFYETGEAAGREAFDFVFLNSDEINVSGNTLVSSDTRWANFWDSATGNFNDNVVVNGGNHWSADSEFEASGNAYYGSSEPLRPDPPIKADRSEANLAELCLTLRGYTDPKEKCLENAVHTEESLHDGGTGFELAW